MWEEHKQSDLINIRRTFQIQEWLFYNILDTISIVGLILCFHSMTFNILSKKRRIRIHLQKLHPFTQIKTYRSIKPFTLKKTKNETCNSTRWHLSCFLWQPDKQCHSQKSVLLCGTDTTKTWTKSSKKMAGSMVTLKYFVFVLRKLLREYNGQWMGHHGKPRLIWEIFREVTDTAEIRTISVLFHQVFLHLSNHISCKYSFPEGERWKSYQIGQYDLLYIKIPSYPIFSKDNSTMQFL